MTEAPAAAAPVAAAKVDSKKRKADDEEVSTKKAKTQGSGSADRSETGTVPEGCEETKQIWVGQLSWNVDDSWLKTVFDEFGTVVSARVQVDRDSQRSKG